MRKSLIGVTLVAAVLFGLGYLLGQVRGASSSSAAGTAPTPSQTQPQPGDAPEAGRPRTMGPHADGQVTRVDLANNTVTLKADADRAGTTEYTAVTTVRLTGATTYATGPESGATATKDSIKVGSYIIAAGTLSKDGTTLSASSVVIMPAGSPGGDLGHFGHFGHFGPRAGGQVTKVDLAGNTVTLAPDANHPDENDAVKTILLTGATIYSAGPESSATATRDSIKVGSYLMVEGTLSSDGKTLTASHVMILPAAPMSEGHFQ